MPGKAGERLPIREGSDRETEGYHMDRRDFPPSHFVISPKCAISGKCLLVMEMGAFSISLAQTGRIRTGEAARGTRHPVEKAPQRMSGMARGAVSLHGTPSALSPQCPAVRQPQYRFHISSTTLPQTIGVWRTPRHIPAHINPGLYVPRNAIIQK